MLSKSILVAANDKILFFLWPSSIIPLYICVCMYIYMHIYVYIKWIFLIHSLVDGHSDCLYTLKAINNATMNIGVQKVEHPVKFKFQINDE